MTGRAIHHFLKRRKLLQHPSVLEVPGSCVSPSRLGIWVTTLAVCFKAVCCHDKYPVAIEGLRLRVYVPGGQEALGLGLRRLKP